VKTPNSSVLVFEVGPSDPLGFAATALIVGAIVMLASLEPARRASVVDPATALRQETDDYIVGAVLGK